MILLEPPELFSNIISGIICLAIFEAAYITEIVRAGIQSIGKGQVEAGEAVGLTRYQAMRWVILPQAIQRVIPPLAGSVHHAYQRFVDRFTHLHSGTDLPGTGGCVLDTVRV